MSDLDRSSGGGDQGQQESASILEELGLLHESESKNGQQVPAVSPIQILQQLLKTLKIDAKDIRQAHWEITKRIKGDASSLKDQEVIRKGAEKPKPFEKQKTDDSSSESKQPIRRRHIALQIYYDGGNYTGLAETVGREEDNSVERALFAALQKTHLILQPSTNTTTTDSEETTPRSLAGYSRCGRTDRGVSAAGQVVALHLKSAFTPDASWDEDGQRLLQDDELPKNSVHSLQVYFPPRNKQGKKKQKQEDSSNNSEDGDSSKQQPRTKRVLCELAYDKILNNVLPPDIRVLGWTPVSDGFSARFSATTRTYRYFFNNENGLLDLSKIQSALSLLEGEHDFRNFCKMDVEHVYNFVRKIHHARLYCIRSHDNTHVLFSNENTADSPENFCGLCYFEIQGQAFLWHQIRCIVAIMFMIGRGLENPSIVAELLDIEKFPGKPSYPLADEKPLVLHNCGYPNLQMGYSVSNLWAVTCHMCQQCEELLLAAARVRNGMNSILEGEVMVDDVKEFCRSRLLERHKKAARYKGKHENGNAGAKEENVDDIRYIITFGDATKISWKRALEWMKSIGLVPDPTNTKELVHIPLDQRSKGTTYEEKVASVQLASTKRKTIYEENIIKKRKTKEEDQAFYDHMTKQGGLAH